MSEKAEVTKKGLLDMQVCVPEDWSDEKVIDFAEQSYPSGTIGGWFIHREGSEELGGYPERNPCNQRKGFVHIMLDV